MGKLFTWLKGLSLLAKTGIAAAVLVGSITALGAAVPTPPTPAAASPAVAQPAKTTTETAAVEEKSAATPSQSPAKSAEASPKVEVKTETATEAIAFKTMTVLDNAIAKGQTVVKVEGANGEKTLTYEVTYTDGKETSRKLVSETISKEPVDKVIHVGTYVAAVPKPQASCDPNYSGCVPIASDVDCAGGNGNGPAYVQGPIRVIGTDIYKLDADHDGIACE